MATQTPKTTKTKIVIPPEGIEARIVDRGGVKVATYDAVVKEDDTDPATPNTDEVDVEDIFESEIPEVVEFPKTQLESMFEDLNFAVKADRQQDGFMAHVMRQPDSIGNNYVVPCNTLMDCGVFQFRTTDFFSFNGEIQRLNGGSGGIFNVKVFKIDRQPLKVARGTAIRPIAREVGLLNYSVPNPHIVDSPAGSSPNEDRMFQFMQQTEQRFNQLMQQMNKPAEQSEIEKLLLRKAIDRLDAPPQTSNNDPAEFMRGLMQQTAVMQAIGQGFAGMFNNTPPPPPEPTTMDTIIQVAELPVVQGLLGNLGNISEQYATSKLGAPAVNIQQNPAQPQPTMTNETQELITDLITELESENPLNADNEFIKELAEDYPDAAEMIKESCQIMQFEQVVQMMIVRTQKMNPNPFVEFIDVAASQAAGHYVWNERGTKMLARLQEFYNFVRNVDAVAAAPA